MTEYWLFPKVSKAVILQDMQQSATIKLLWLIISQVLCTYLRQGSMLQITAAFALNHCRSCEFWNKNSNNLELCKTVGKEDYSSVASVLGSPALFQYIEGTTPKIYLFLFLCISSRTGTRLEWMLLYLMNHQLINKLCFNLCYRI